MNFEHLKTLNMVVESVSISLAAKRLYKTQPAVSMIIKRLEQDVGFTLFDRSGYRMELTEKGQIYFEKSKLILGQVAHLESLGESFTRGEEHEIKMAIEGTANVNQVMASLVPVQQQFVNTQLHILGTHMLYALRYLRQQEVDLAVTPWLVTFESEGDFESKFIGTLDFNFCIHKTLAAKHGIHSAADVTLEKLHFIPQITPNDLAFNMEKTNLLRKVSRSVVKVDDIHCFLAALKGQIGWGPISHFAFSEYLGDDFIRFDIDKDPSMIAGEIRIVKNRNKILGPAAQAIWDCVDAQFQTVT